MKITKTLLRKMIKEEIQALNEISDYYDADYYDKQGGHGSLGNWPKFETAFKKAVKLYKQEEKVGWLGKYTGYIGVSGNTNKFAIIYIDEDYYKKINSSWFNSPKDMNVYKAVAKKVLSTGKPQIGTYKSMNEIKYRGYDIKRQNRKDGHSLIIPALRKTGTDMKDIKRIIDNELDEIINEAVKESKLISDIRWIVDHHQAKKINGTLVDAFTAQHIIGLYDKLSDKYKEMLNGLKLDKLVALVWKLSK